MTDEHLLPEDAWSEVVADAERIESLLSIEVDQAEADKYAPTAQQMESFNA